MDYAPRPVKLRNYLDPTVSLTINSIRFPNTINHLVIPVDMECVLCEVGTVSLYKIKANARTSER